MSDQARALEIKLMQMNSQERTAEVKRLMHESDDSRKALQEVLHHHPWMQFSPMTKRVDPTHRA